MIALAARSCILGGDEGEQASVLELLLYNDVRFVPWKPLPLVREYGHRDHYSMLKDREIDTVHGAIFEEIRTIIPRGITFPNDTVQRPWKNLSTIPGPSGID